ncbi:MAG: ribonuclease HI family protein [Bdellovibrionales bacterium]|nr:ribonuclease HI family protein [Bdellovibrionales bacterium]
MIPQQKIQKGKVNGWPSEVLIHTDGASRGNPGAASAGLAVYDNGKICIYEEAFLLGTKTNNFAEYSAVLRALQLSSENKVKNLLLKSDSEFLVKQLSGLYKVKSPNIKKLYEECKKWEAEISQVKFQHVRREQNKRADELANLVLDGYDISNDTDRI